MGKQRTSVGVFVNGPALDTRGRLLWGLRFQTLADIAKAAVIHGTLEGVALPPEAKRALVNSSLRKKAMDLNLHVVAMLGVPVSASWLISLSAARGERRGKVSMRMGMVGVTLERLGEADLGVRKRRGRLTRRQYSRQKAAATCPQATGPGH